MGNAPRYYDTHLIEFQKTAYVKSIEEYEELYKRSLEDIDEFWAEQARRYLTWDKEWEFVHRHDAEEAQIEWFGGGVLNASSNCLDRHLGRLDDKVVYHWEGDNPSESRSITYRDLYKSVNKLAVFLKSRGVEKGDRVLIYAPMTIELPTAMLACARIGAVHCVICTGFGRDIIADRILRCKAKVVITADGAYTAGNLVPLKHNVDEALKQCPGVETVIVLNRCKLDIQLDTSKEVWWHDAINDESLPSYVAPEPMAAEDPLFILFAGGAIGKPYPLVHSHGGYLLWAAMTTSLVFDLKENETFWCTSDPGWITGHTLSVYGPLISGLSVVLFEGVPTYPDCGRYWEIVDKYRVDKFCTGPTAIRTLAAEGPSHIEKHDISSLKLLGSADELLSPEAWTWYYHYVGKDRCPLMATWWQTESGGPMMTPLPGVGPLKAGSVSSPFFGVEPVILDLDTGERTRFPNQEGAFFVGRPWPGIARTIFGDHERFREEYFAPFLGLFITGEGAKRDEDGFYWMTGRIDDVINVSGHRIGAWEIESALVSHRDVSEATVVGFPHPIKGQGLYAFVTLTSGQEKSEDLKELLARWLLGKIGTIAIPDVIQWAEDLPKTRSGKILRRLLQKIAEGQVEDLGDMSTVANPEVIDGLIKDRMGIPEKQQFPGRG